MNGRTHIDLFSGIGGFALAAGWAGLRTVAFCEIEPYCQAILAARFGAVTHSDAGGCQPDIREAVSGWQGAPVPRAAIEELEKVRQNWRESVDRRRGNEGIDRWDDAMDQAIRAVVGEGK